MLWPILENPRLKTPDFFREYLANSLAFAIFASYLSLGNDALFKQKRNSLVVNVLYFCVSCVRQ
jgi:hypothetical protein